MCVCVCVLKHTRCHAHTHTYTQSYCSFSVQAVEVLTAAGIELQVIECDKEVRGIEMQVCP
jgi:glutaredoxin